METLTPFTSQAIEAVARILGDTADGLTGTEIGLFLQDAKIPDIDKSNTKWKRIYNAVANIQNTKGVGNHLLMFVNRAMNPARYTSDVALFKQRIERLNAVLLLSGFEIQADGRVHHVASARSLDEAVQRANQLSSALASRGVHPDVLAYCRAELLEKNYFHAVFEATKSIAAKVRNLSGLDGDGADLIQRAFSWSKDSLPVLAINDLTTETERGEQRGFVSLLVGLFGTVRNPLAHNPKIEWPMSEKDALDILTLTSLLHRKLDKVKAVQRAN